MTARDKLVILVLLAAATLAGLWFLVLSPQREEAGRISGDVETQRRALEDAEAKVELARRAQAGYASNYTTIAQLGKAVPPDDDISSLVYQLESAARDAHVDFRAVILDEQAAATAAATASAGAGPSGPSGPTGGDGSAGEDPGAPTTSGPTPVGTGPTGGAGPAGESAAAGGAAAAPTPVPFTFTFEGHFLRLARFLRDVDRFADARRGDLRVSGRLMTVEGISLVPSQDGFPVMTAEVRALTYMAPPLGAQGGASPPGGTAPATGGTTVTPAAEPGAASRTAPTAPATAPGP